MSNQSASSVRGNRKAQAKLDRVEQPNAAHDVPRSSSKTWTGTLRAGQGFPGDYAAYFASGAS